MPSRDVQRNPAEIRDDFIGLCAYHPRFMGRELTHAERIQLEGFAKTYAEYERLIDGLQDTSRHERFNLPLKEWKELDPKVQYALSEQFRAMDIAKAHLALQAETGGIPPGPRLDVGARSNMFAGFMNCDALIKRTGNKIDAEAVVRAHPDDLLEQLESPWYAADLPLTKPLPTTDTFIDREKLPGFEEIGPDGKLPHKGKQFQAITLNMALHHVDPGKLDALLKDAYDRLAPGGKLFVLEDVIGWEKEDPVRRAVIKDFVDGFFYPDAPGNQKPMAEWRRIIEKAGFKHIIDSEFVTRNIVGIAVEEGMMAFEKPKHA